MLDWLKDILGESYSEEIDKKISAEIGKAFVARADFNTKNEEKKALAEQLESANKQIEEFKSMDIEGIRKAADDWKEKFENAENEYKKKVAEMTFDNLLSDKLSDVKFTSEYAKKGVFNEIKEKGLKVDNGSIIGFDEVFESIKKAQPSAFESDEPKPQFTKTLDTTNPTSNTDALRAAMGLPPENK